MGKVVSPRLVQLLNLKAMGLPRDEIAAQMGIHPTTVWQLTQRPEFKLMWQKTCENVQSDVKDRLLALSERAVGTVGNVMTDVTAPHRVRLTAAQDVLDRTGHGVKREQANTFQVLINAEQLNVILGVARELGARPAAFLDAGHVQGQFVLPDQSSTGQEQARGALAPGDVRPPAAIPAPEDPYASSSWPLQDNDWR